MAVAAKQISSHILNHLTWLLPKNFLGGLLSSALFLSECFGCCSFRPSFRGIYCLLFYFTSAQIQLFLSTFPESPCKQSRDQGFTLTVSLTSRNNNLNERENRKYEFYLFRIQTERSGPFAGQTWILKTRVWRFSAHINQDLIPYNLHNLNCCHRKGRNV